jgi:RNA polymerase sigma-70 factor (ECF subfamily)
MVMIREPGKQGRRFGQLFAASWNASAVPPGSGRVEERAGDLRTRCDRAFAEHVVPEVGVLFRVALSITAQPADAEDLVQETLLRAYRGIAAFDGRHPRAWLLTILRNAAANRYRRQRPHLLDDPDAAVDRLAVVPDGAGDPEEIIVGRSFDAVVDAALRSLPDKYRQVQLVDVDGLSYAEAAQLLKVPGAR